MKEIPLKNTDKKALVDDEDYENLSKLTWYFHSKNGYATTPRSKGSRSMIYMHQLINQPKPEGMITDHINMNKLDNRRENLRFCTKSQNSANRGLNKANKTGYKGVSWSKHKNKWEVYITLNYKHVFVGRYNELIEAAKAYDNKAKEVFGEFARTNF